MARLSVGGFLFLAGKDFLPEFDGEQGELIIVKMPV